MKASDLFTLPASLDSFSEFFKPTAQPWEWVKAIKPALASLDFTALPKREDIPEGVHIEGDVYIHESVKLPPYASIKGPAWIGENTEIRPGAYIRGNVIIAANCVIGNSSEYKNCMLMDGAQTPHYNYIGDSVLGNKAHLGAGVICSNLRLDQEEIKATTDNGKVDTGMRKLGAIMGDASEVGCNSSLQPGTILGKRALVMPCLPFGGYLPADQIAVEPVKVKFLPRRD